jgi:hypothetical protein
LEVQSGSGLVQEARQTVQFQMTSDDLLNTEWWGVEKGGCVDHTKKGILPPSIPSMVLLYARNKTRGCKGCNQPEPPLNELAANNGA